MEQSHRGRRAAQSMRTLASHANAQPAVRGPLIARFVEADDTTYLVGELEGNRTAKVPKRRAWVEPYSPEQRRRRASERLLRWSSYALVGVVFGGILGIVLGGIVVLAALARLARLSNDIRRWRRRHRASRDQQPQALLPVEATGERILLVAALGQGFLAILLGGTVLLAIVEMR